MSDKTRWRENVVKQSSHATCHSECGVENGAVANKVGAKSMGAHSFPSGRWTGYYVYDGDTARRPMSARIKFTGGTLFGEGADEIGAFTFSGWYAEDTGDCAWVKRYIGAHDVDYRGARDGKGIWGTWSIGAFRGGFHLWPEQEETAVLTARHDAEAPAVPHESTVL